MLENFWRPISPDVVVIEIPGRYGVIQRRQNGYRWVAARSFTGWDFTLYFFDGAGDEPTAEAAKQGCEERLLRDYTGHEKAALLRQLMQARPVPPLP
jgi:hypothetical protein